MIGTSEETKPSTLPPGSEFFETDTGQGYIFNGSSWTVKSYVSMSHMYKWDSINLIWVADVLV
jgi:hypothetical protein